MQINHERVSDVGSGWKKIEGPKSGQTQVDTPIEEEVAQWCHPIDCHLVSKGLQGWPKLILEVRRQDQYGRSDLAGYGTCHVPPTPGTHILEVPTWRPAGMRKHLHKKNAVVYIYIVNIC